MLGTQRPRVLQVEFWPHPSVGVQFATHVVLFWQKLAVHSESEVQGLSQSSGGSDSVEQSKTVPPVPNGGPSDPPPPHPTITRPPKATNKNESQLRITNSPEEATYIEILHSLCIDRKRRWLRILDNYSMISGA
jgi:hypothetical protein